MTIAHLPRSAPEVPVNLLPDQIKTEQKAKRIFAIAGIGLIALIVILATVTLVQRKQIGDAKRTLAASQAEAAQLQSRVSSLAQYAALQLSVDQSRQTLSAALVNDVSWSKFLDDLDTNIPGDSWMTSLNMSATPGTTPEGEVSYGTVQYSGVVRTFPGLANWLNVMNGIDGLRFVYLSNGSKTDQNGVKTVTFSATANMTSTMLSTRCQGDNTPCP